MATTRLTLFLGLLCAVVFANAQEVKFINLTAVQQRTALRYPPGQPRCDTDPCVLSGSGGSGVADGAPDKRDPHSLGVSLDQISPTDITLDPFEAEFRVVNTGLASIEVPVSPHLSDLQPVDERKTFEYLSLVLVIKLEGTGPEQALGIGWIELYGSTNDKDTIVTLQQGGWIRVKSKVRLHTWPSKPVTAELTGDFWLRTNVFTPGEGTSFTQFTNLYPNRTSFPSITARFNPTRFSQEH